MTTTEYQYQESQFGLYMSIAMITGILACVGLHFLEPRSFTLSTLLFICGLFVVIGLLFYQMKTTIANDVIKVSFGIGLLRFTIGTSSIQKVEEVKTPWYYGKGIRYTPLGTIYNIQGSKAVSIDLLEDGKKRTVIIGTKTPNELIKALTIIRNSK